MTEQNIVDIESAQLQRRQSGRARPENQLKKADLSSIAASDVLILATAIGSNILTGLEMREKRKLRFRLLLIASGLAFLIGMVRLAIQLIQS